MREPLDLAEVCQALAVQDMACLILLDMLPIILCLKGYSSPSLGLLPVLEDVIDGPAQAVIQGALCHLHTGVHVSA